jgi:hypothetical protein
MSSWFKVRPLPLPILAALLVLFTLASQANAQGKKAAPKAPRAARLFKVQVRQPFWRAAGVVTSKPAAEALKATLVRQGWRVKIKREGESRWVVLGRITHWNTVGRFTNRAVAEQIAVNLRARGTDSRVVAATARKP